MFKTNISGHNNIWWITKNVEGTALECSRACVPCFK